MAFVDSQKRLDSLMYTVKRGMKKSSGKKPRDFLRDLKQKKGHLQGNKLLIKLDLTPRLKKD